MRGERTRGALVVGATFLLFLLFAQFGFLDQTRADLHSPTAVRGVMAAMGIAGLAASLATPRLLAVLGGRRVVRVTLVFSASIAATSLAARGLPALAVAGAAIGASIGVLTVAVAATLPDLVPGPHRGRSVGLATGLAYLAANIPALFDAAPATRAVVPAVVCVAAAALLRRGTDCESVVHRDAVPAASTSLFARALVTLTILVAIDSAAFALIHADPALGAATWSTVTQKAVQGGTHLIAALFAGVAIDAGLVVSCLVTTWVLFALALPPIFAGAADSGAAAPVYAAGIAVYSTALVLMPSLGDPSRSASRWRAALLYGGGWLGSAVGVGAAQDLATLPPGLLGAAGVLIAIAWLWPTERTLFRIARPFGAAIGLGLAGVSVVGIPHLLPAPRRANPALAVERGRALYVSEGCIHCHSQYVRRVGRDVEWWGPSTDLERRATPVLVGNRRQGPDLATIGNRRSLAWQVMHLAEPRRISPGSRMPSYAHLFADGDPRGRDLAAYLLSLGEESLVGRIERGAPEPVPSGPGSRAHGEQLFGRYCASCHGAQATGDGPLADAMGLRVPTMNLRKGPLELVRPQIPGEPLEAALRRFVRHGLTGSAMAGHETLPDADIADLAAYVSSLTEETRR